LEVNINGKQDFINDNDLSIIKTLGLEDALNSKQPTITNSSLSIARTIGLQDALNGKQATLIEGNTIIITNNTISSTGGSDKTQEDLDLKQDTLSLNSNLSIKSLLVTNDTFSSATNVAGQVKCDSLEIRPGLSTGGAIIGKC